MAELKRRAIEPLCRELLSAVPAIIINGARQVGKSTLVSQLVGGGASYTLDDEATRDAITIDPSAYILDSNDQPIAIDEIQRRPDLLLAVKASIDRDRRPGRFILTGSSDVLRHRATRESLAGRSIGIRLFGFSVAEAAGTPVDAIARLFDAFSRSTPPDCAGIPRADYVERIVTGSYPQAQSASHRVRNLWFDSYLEQLLTRDAADLSRVEPARLQTVLRLLAANQAGELVKARVASAASLPASTITSYLDLLQQLYLIDVIRPFTPNATTREVGRPKVVVSDSGLAARLSSATDTSLLALPPAPQLGGLFEGLIASELLAQSAWSRADFKLWHFRDRHGLEVDLVVERSDGAVLGIEVKSSTSYRGDQFTNLARFASRLPDRFVGGLVLGMAPSAYRYTDKLWGLPASVLWTGLG